MDVKLVNNINIILDALHDQLEKGLEECGLLAESYAKRECPVDTGALRNSISHYVNAGEGEAYVGTNMEYGIYVEYGTGVHASGGRQTPWNYQDAKGKWHHTNGMPARPFIKPAAEHHGQEYVAIMINNLKNG